jgi:glycosyltransferase involved in cell wall biosynthesis
MKIALVHDYIKEYGGAERVLEALHEIWPEAPIFTTVFLPQFLGPHQKRFEKWDIRPSWLQRIPFVHKFISPIRLLTPWIFENIDLTKYDAILVSATGAYFPNLLVRKPETIHFCYCHTPPRYLYGYPTARNFQNSAFGRLVAGYFNHGLREIDFVSYQRPDYIIANSHEIQKRIWKFYRREANIIYPPVDMELRIKNKEFGIKKKTYYITGGRLARAKHIDLAILACNKLKLPLKVFGKSFADYGDELIKIAGPTIEFTGEVGDEQLRTLFAGAKALIYPSEYEDFGIIPVEAMAVGTPVIGINQGGVKETVIDKKTGILFDELSVDSTVKAIGQFNHSTIKPQDCINHAHKFSKARFQKEIKEFVMSHLE